MRLKSLEIKGFKSFANETVINFNEDVIGVVGPNGSGKSNVVDAMRWVLGEQKSKELRLEKMSNIIFNGTKKRKQSGLASVSLTFENTKNLLPTEYHTVKITRILYRSGESEYRLNGVTCRLKDITSLFLDTGIGSNSYAIIALGMIDDILNDKENSRRRMFEQAAGISKYKKRKRETLNKLKNTTADLDRVEDLLFEIEGNLKSLEKQAKRTKKFYELKEKYKKLSIELAVVLMADHKVKHVELKSKLEQEEDKHRQFEVESRKLEAHLEETKKNNLDKEKALSERQRDLNAVVGLVREMENNKNILIQKMNFVEQNRAKLTEQISGASFRLEQLEEEITSYRSRLNEEKDIEEELEQKLETAQQKLNEIRENHGSLKTELDEVMQKQQGFEREIFELEKKKAINTNRVENLRHDISVNESEIASRKKEIEELDRQLAVVNEEESKKQIEVDSIVAEEEKRQQNIVIAEEKLDKLRKEIADVNRKLDSQRNEYKLTKSMVENLEGFPESIKFLSKNKNWIKDAPLLSDLIYCKEEYRVAIENYLGPYLNYYVVQNLEQAFGAIKLLSDAQKGKANFFVLDTFKSYTEPMTMLPETKRAIDLIEVDGAYRNLCSYLLENVLVTDSEELVNKVGEKDIILLSKTGRFIQRRFSISGGSVGLFEGKKIGRKKNLEVLELSIKKLEREESELSTNFYTVKSQLEDLKANIKNDVIRRERDVLNQISQRKVSLMTRLENFESFQRNADVKRQEAEAIIKELVDANTLIDKDLAQRKVEAEEAKAQISNTDVSYRKVAEELSEASTVFNNNNIEFIRQQNKVNSFQQELSFREKQNVEIQEQLETNKRTVANSEQELEEHKVDLAQIEATLLTNYDLKKERESSLTIAEQSYFQGRGGINETDDKLRFINRQRQETLNLITNLKDKFNELKLKLTSTTERLKIEFNVTMDEVMSLEPNPELNIDETQLVVDKIKKRLDNYGEINPMAVEAYDEMNERYQTIAVQRDDILEAKDSLLETIKEIETTATSQFMEAFLKAREYFIDVFRSLFTEDDNCDLLLEDPENPLDSKIKIVAKPKGKRPQSINQLSGGEKTLTATALLFSLYLLKPAPFCIFDEVDAPLDDANIEKFNRIIKKFSKESQFIIVTHNKQTMAAVDVIYGIYMHEQGVSSVSAVDFRQLEHSSLLETVVED